VRQRERERERDNGERDRSLKGSAPRRRQLRSFIPLLSPSPTPAASPPPETGMHSLVAVRFNFSMRNIDGCLEGSARISERYFSAMLAPEYLSTIFAA